jgi:hypothetical protein
MKNAGIALLIVASVVVGILGYNALKPQTLHAPTTAEVKVQLDKLKADAQQKHPNMATSDAMKVEATRQASAMLEQGNADTRAKTAAGIFFGAYYMNTRARPAYCQQRGVDLATFVAAYDQVHREELSHARKVFARIGIDPESMVPKIQSQFVSVIEQDMKDFAAGAQVPLDKTCEMFNQNAKMLAEAITVPADVRLALLAAD